MEHELAREMLGGFLGDIGNFNGKTRDTNNAYLFLWGTQEV